MASNGNRIFVSSTCYDLLDLRAEVEHYLRGLGLVPIMSDRPASEFETAGYKDSIETCLANVRTSDAFICILSPRYGPPLGASGFKDVSATHLEYLEARAAGLPIYMYARDRLLGEYSVWKRNGGAKGPTNLKFVWIPSDNEPIFSFIHEHQTLVAGAPESNWLWSFRDSYELKDRLSVDFRARSSPALLRRLIEQGRLPILRLAHKAMSREGNRVVLSVMVNCLGEHVALAPRIKGHNGDKVSQLRDITPTGPGGATIILDLEAGSSRREVELEYDTVFGHVIADTFSVSFKDGTGFESSLVRKRLVGGLSYELT